MSDPVHYRTGVLGPILCGHVPTTSKTETADALRVTCAECQRRMATFDSLEVDCDDCRELLAQEVEMRLTDAQALLVAGSRRAFEEWCKEQGEFVRSKARHVTRPRDILGFSHIAFKVLHGADPSFVGLVLEQYKGRCTEVT